MTQMKDEFSLKYYSQPRALWHPTLLHMASQNIFSSCKVFFHIRIPSSDTPIV